MTRLRQDSWPWVNIAEYLYIMFFVHFYGGKNPEKLNAWIGNI